MEDFFERLFDPIGFSPMNAGQKNDMKKREKEEGIFFIFFNLFLYGGMKFLPVYSDIIAPF